MPNSMIYFKIYQYNLLQYQHNGMINTGYFTSRKQIIDWINSLLKVELTRIEQLGSGNLYCQILDAAFPGQVPLNKVKWGAYLEVDSLYNFKILQTCFQKLGIKRGVQTQKLVKAKYQDNLQFIQWIKWNFSQSITKNMPYDAPARRNYADVHLLFEEKVSQNKRSEKENIRYPKMKESYLLKNSKSAEQIKILPCSQQNLRKAFEKGESLRALLEQQPIDLRKDKRKKIQVTLKPSLALQERKVYNSNQQECF